MRSTKLAGPRLAILAALPLLTLAACAHGGGGNRMASNDWDKQKAQCDARGGILKQRTTGPITPYEQLNSYCDVTAAPNPNAPIRH